MAITSVGTGGTGVSSTSSSSFTLTLATNTINAADFRFGVLTVVSDNIGTTDAQSNEITSVTGGAGTWTKLGEFRNGNGAAAAGVTTALYLFVASGANATGTVFTINLSGATVDKAASLWVFTLGTAGTSIALDTTAPTNPQFSAIDAATGFGSQSFTGLSSRERLYFRGCGKEANSTTQITPSTNFTAITANRSRNNASAQIVRGEFRINTSTGETSAPTLAVTGDTSCVFAALIELPSAQTLTPALFTNNQTFFDPTVTRGTVTLTPALFTNDQTFYSATVTATYSLTPALFTNNQTFFGPTVTATYALTPALFTNNQTFYSATVSQAGAVQNLTPALFTNTQTFYGPTVTATYTLTPALFTNTQVFYGPTVTRGAVNLTPALFTNTQVFYGPTVTATRNLTPALFTNAQTFFAPTITATRNLTPALFTNAQTFYSATVSQAGGLHNLAPALFTNQQTFFSATVTGGDQQASGGGSRRRRKFRPAVLIPLSELKFDASVNLPQISAKASIFAPIAAGEITYNAEVRLKEMFAMTDIRQISACSKFNDPTEMEMALIAELLFD